MDDPDEFLTPAKAGATALTLTVVNPKVLFLCAAAGLAIGSAGIDVPTVYAAVAWYVLVAGSTVLLPVLAYAVSGQRLDLTLARIRAWLERQHAALIAAIFIVIGILVLYKGIHGL